MEKILVHAKFNTAHRQLGYAGKCKFVHGHTWRASVAIATQRFPRDELDMSLDFGDIKDIVRFLDHKIIVTEQDARFLDADSFEPDGVVPIKGRGPSVENVASHLFEKVADHIRGKFPGRGISYLLEVTIQETENNFFIVQDTVVI